MIPFTITIALGFISFLASAFVILRIVIPILPPHPLSRRVAPVEFGLPNYNFRSLTSADKSHLWLASLDLVALCVFIWQIASEYYSGGVSGFGDSKDAAAAAKLWFALTIRQNCLFVVSGLALIHIRMGRPVSFGRKHWMVWAPTSLLSLASTTLTAVLAGAGVPSLFAGIIAYSTITAILSSAAFGGLVYTLVVIKRNLAALNEPTDPWPPVKEVEQKRQPSFATEDVDALREGSSWLTSDAGSSRHESMSNWSFSTHHTTQASTRLSAGTSQPCSQSKSVHWFNQSNLVTTDPSIPPMPPLPSVYRGNNASIRDMDEDLDPFRRDLPGRFRLGSQSSGLTSPSVPQATVSAWSLSATPINGSIADLNGSLQPNAQSSRPVTPMTSVVDLNAALLPELALSGPATLLSSANVLGGYGYSADSEKGIASLAVTSTEVEISYFRYVFWLLSIWVPFVLSLPYLFSLATLSSAPKSFAIMLVLSVTSSSLLLALNIIIRSPIPIPTGLFDVHAEPPSAIMRAPSPTETLATYCRGNKKSGSVTVVEDRRSGDVWVSQGDAVEGKGKFGRAFGLMTPLPRLAVLPPEGGKQDGEITPPLPMQEDTTFGNTTDPTRQSTNSMELGRLRTESKDSSHFSREEAFATRIMIAQRHYSAVATTVIVPASPERMESPDGLLSVATGVDVVPPVTPTTSSHLRSRSVSSVFGQAATPPDTNAPPSQPLPPTPPNIRIAKQTAKQLLHRKSRSSDFSFGAVINDDIKEIDALTAGVLPLLVPGLQLGEDIKIRNLEEFSPPFSSTVTKKKATKAICGSKLGVIAPGRDDFGSPQFHSTPAQGKQSHRQGKVSGHKRNHLSLPSLVLGDGAAGAWKDDLSQELGGKIGQYATLPAADRRNTVWGDETVPNVIAHPVAESQTQKCAPVAGEALGHLTSTLSAGLRTEIPEATGTARTSLATLIVPSAASTATLLNFQQVFEPTTESTPQDAQKGYAYSRRYQTTAMSQTTNSRRSSIIYIKTDERSSELISEQRNNSPPTLAPSKLLPKSLASGNKQTPQSGGLRPLSLLKDRDSNREGYASKFAGMRPLALGKKQKTKESQDSDENIDPNSGSKHLKPLRLGRSSSSKQRGKLRRNEVLPTVVVRPPSTNAKIGSSYEYR